MRAQSPTSKFITTTRLVSSPHSTIRDQRSDSQIHSKVAKITTVTTTRPKTTITTTSYRPIIETRTVRLCTEKKCQGHEQQIEQLYSENQQLLSRVRELELELENVSIYSRQKTSIHSNEVDSIRKLYEESQLNHKQEIQYLSSEISQYKQQFEHSDEQVKYLTSQLKKQSNNQNLENQIVLLSSELERCNILISEKNDFIETLQGKINELDSRLIARDQHIEDLENDFMKLKKQYQEACNQIVLLRAEIERQTEQYQQINCSIQSERRTIEQQLYILDQKDTQLNQIKNNQQLLEMRLQEQQTTIQAQVQEIDNLLLRLDTMSQQIEYHQTECDELLKLRAILTTELEQTKAQNIALNEQLQKQRQQNTDSNKTIENLKLELNQQLTQIHSDYTFELHSKQDELEATKTNFQSEFNCLTKRYQEETYTLKITIEDLENELKNLNELNTRLQLAIDDKINEIQLLKSQCSQISSDFNIKNQELAEENHKLKHNIEDALMETNISNKKRLQLEQTVLELNAQIQELNLQIQLLQNETQSLKLRSGEENSTLRIQIEQLEQSIILLQQMKSQLQKELDAKILEINNLQEQFNEHKQKSQTTIKELEYKLREYEEKLSLLSSEIQRMLIQINQKNDMIQEQNITLEEYAKKIQELSTQNNDDKQLQQQKYEELITQMREKQFKLESENLSYKGLIEEQNSVIETLSKQMDGLAGDLRYQQQLEGELTKKNAFLTNKLSDSDQEIAEWKFKVDHFEIENKSLKAELELHCDSESELKFKLDKLIEELAKKQQLINEYEIRIKETENTQINEVQQFEEKITYYQNEVDTWKKKFVILNRDYHKCQEDLMMVQAEFEASKQRPQIVRESSVFEVRKSSLYKENVKDIKEVKQSSIVRPLSEVNI